MQLLLDTHIVLWALDDASSQLATETMSIINNPDNIVYVSMVTLWEIGVKANTGRLVLPHNFFDSLPELGYEILMITIPHLKHYIDLPLYHRDPFDRMLIAQAITEQLTLVTRDSNMAKYEVTTLVA